MNSNIILDNSVLLIGMTVLIWFITLFYANFMSSWYRQDEFSDKMLLELYVRKERVKKHYDKQ